MEQVEAILSEELRACTPEQAAFVGEYRVASREVPLGRFGRWESAIVVAQRGDVVLYWEDVEEGWELSPLDSQGRIGNRGCNQLELRHALHRWMQGEANTGFPDGPSAQA